MNAQRTLSSRSRDEVRRPAGRARASPGHPVLALQRAAGNRAVAGLLHGGPPHVARQSDAGVDGGSGGSTPRAVNGAPPATQRFLDLMHQSQPGQSAGVGNPAAAFQLLDSLPMSELLRTLVALRASGYPVSHVPGYPGVRVARMEAAVVAADLSPQTRPFSEAALADLRDRTAGLAPAERSEVIAFVPEAQPPVVVTTDADATPPPGSPYAGWPLDLRRSVARSFRERAAAAVNSRDNLANAYWGAGVPATWWEALDRYPSAILLANYQRATAAGFPWSAVHTVGHAWSGTSAGLAFVPADEGAMRTAMNGSARFCHDSWLSGSEHPGAECWREVIFNAPGVHICLGGPKNSSLHIDAHQVVNGRDSDGVCDINYVGRAGISHARDLGWF